MTSWVSLLSPVWAKCLALTSDLSEMNINIYSIGLQILHKCPDNELWERGKGLRKRHKKDAITVQGN